MHDKVTFEYAIIRLVPRVEREEFFNIGVILFSKRKRFLGVKFKVDQQKLNAFSCELDLDAINSYLKSWELISKGETSGGAIAQFELSDRFRWLAASRSTVIQSSKTHSGLTENPELELQSIFEKHVLDAD
ncbi:hypothetical protein ADIWIN_0790 [Winogradskyella psychrotolerans RS-3]|uniref:DUF3037 domain-containing protein n=1 Tax=Winogradskyella psychrotolerans RS-3 TaxID=641526 RepID=S7XE09_9FLAO|nr:DUF3037 domain-containing protein [Winogradskyella psychrotolerans]EPR74213.1 hypothetical protein ADIWIN_0790 [Winogradskyella psychrotolerans RS-3]